ELHAAGDDLGDDLVSFAMDQLDLDGGRYRRVVGEALGQRYHRRSLLGRDRVIERYRQVLGGGVTKRAGKRLVPINLLGHAIAKPDHQKADVCAVERPQQSRQRGREIEAHRVSLTNVPALRSLTTPGNWSTWLCIDT